MKKEELLKYWIDSSNKDFQAMIHLLEKGDLVTMSQITEPKIYLSAKIYIDAIMQFYQTVTLRSIEVVSVANKRII